MKVALLGYGKMGREIAALCLEQGIEIVGWVTSTLRDFSKFKHADVCIDFSSPSGVLENIKIIAAMKKPYIIGTTGWEKEIEYVKGLVDIYSFPLLFSANFSFGFYLFQQLLIEANHSLKYHKNYDVSILETHHHSKKDMPSGTAKWIQEIFHDKPAEISSVRVGDHCGVHEILLKGLEETITLTHTAKNRRGFSKGAVEVAQWIQDQPPGFYTLEDFMRGNLYA